MDVSLTSFVDFATKAGMSQITALKEIKRQQEEDYAPFRDFYKKLREGIVDFHRRGSTNKRELDALARGLPDSKVNHYELLIKGYKKFLGRKDIAWFEPVRTDWQEAGLTVRVNPELGLDIAGQRHLVKLHFKQHKLSKRLAEPLLHLMASTLGPEYRGNAPAMSILDIRHAALFSSSNDPDPNVLLLLTGHARMFMTMYDKVV